MTEKSTKTSSTDLYSDRRNRYNTMRLSILEGAFAVIALGLQQAFYIPYLHALGATKFQVGIGAGLPALMTGIIQILVPTLLTRTRNYKLVLALSTFAQALCFVPFAMMYYIVPKHPVWPSLAAIAVSSVAAGIGAGLWADLMSHVVPRRRRGKYFARRNQVITIIQLVVSIAASRMLDTAVGKVMLVFTIIWIAAFLTRSVSAMLFLLHCHPAGLEHRPRITGGFVNFVRNLPASSFGRFAVAISILNLAVNFSGPFFTVHMLEDLHFTYIQYIIIHLSTIIMTLLTAGIWGRICDRIGNVMPMRITATMVAAVPLPWLMTQNFWILLVVSLTGGIAWGGFTMSSFNYTIAAVSPANRATYISYLNVISSVCIFTGCLLGGFTGPYLPLITKYQLHSIFLVSVLIRLPAILIFQLVREDKPKHLKMNAIERFFFDPRLDLRTGFSRAAFSKQKRPM